MTVLMVVALGRLGVAAAAWKFSEFPALLLQLRRVALVVRKDGVEVVIEFLRVLVSEAANFGQDGVSLHRGG